jgi:adenosylcobinamide-phosphate synthase
LGLAFPFLLGYLLDLLLGDPPDWPHPVRLLGRAVSFWEKALYRPWLAAGAVFWLAVMAMTLAAVLAVLWVLALLHPLAGTLGLAYLVYTGLATRSLHLESRRVEEALARGDLSTARERLSLVVGRETANLSAAEVRRAAVETVAENLADGVVAPMFFLILLGLPGLFLYKAANTLDSMVGYKNARYAQFGQVSARADDVLNFLPARLTALLMIPAARVLGLDGPGAWRILRRDAGKASSPNAGWPEAAMAGALGVRLGGPSTYFGQVVNKPFIGDPSQALDASHYPQAVRLLYATSLLMAAITLLTLLASGAGVWGLSGLCR